MTSSSNDDNILRISKHLLLSSPPGQFDIILSDLLIILSENKQQASLLDSNWIQQVKTEFESRSGKSILRSTTNKTNDGNDIDRGIVNDDGANDDALPSSSSGTTTSEMERSLEEQMKKYLETYYSSKGVTSNIQITTTTCSSSGDGSSTFTILLYAERIQLPQYHAGSWLSRYNITLSPNLKQLTMDGTVILHAHTFENGNVQMNSTTSLGPITIMEVDQQPNNNAANVIVEKIQSWEEDHVVTPLHEAYENLGTGVLKKLRRVMPVTRTKFDWNVASHRLHKNIGMGIEQNK